MPYIGLIPFLHENDATTRDVINIVSMPYIGLIPFLQRHCKRMRTFGDCVNALHRAYPISTRCVGINSLAKVIVSMPYIGLIPFLLVKKTVTVDTDRCVNALHRAYPISTVPFKKPYKINGFRDRFQGVIVRKF